MFCAQPYLLPCKSDCKYVAELQQIRGGTTCIRSATCLYSTKITAKTWLYQREQTYPQSGLPRLHKATVRPSHRKSTPARRPGLVLIRFVPCLHPPCALVGLDGRPPSSRDSARPRCFAHAWPFQRRWVMLGTDDRAGGSRRGCHGTRPFFEELRRRYTCVSHYIYM